MTAARHGAFHLRAADDHWWSILLPEPRAGSGSVLGIATTIVSPGTIARSARDGPPWASSHGQPTWCASRSGSAQHEGSPPRPLECSRPAGQKPGRPATVPAAFPKHRMPPGAPGVTCKPVITLSPACRRSSGLRPGRDGSDAVDRCSLCSPLQGRSRKLTIRMTNLSPGGGGRDEGQRRSGRRLVHQACLSTVRGTT